MSVFCPFGDTKFNLVIEVGNMKFDLEEQANIPSLDQWTAFAEGEKDYVSLGDRYDSDGMTSWEITVSGDTATVRYNENYGWSMGLSVDIPVALLREQIRSQLEIFNLELPQTEN